MAKSPPSPYLPISVVDLILQKVSNDVDALFSCAKVCVSWRLIAKKLLDYLTTEAPLILLTSQGISSLTSNWESIRDDAPPNQVQCRLFDIKTLRVHVKRVPHLRGRWFRSCSNGWLFTVGCQSLQEELHLVNPLTGITLRLPHSDLPEELVEWKRLEPPGSAFVNYAQEPCYDSLIRLVVTSTSPSDPNCRVLGGQEFCTSIHVCRPLRPGNQAWTKIGSLGSQHQFKDGISYRGEFYCLERIITHRNENGYIYHFIDDFYGDDDDDKYYMTWDHFSERLIKAPERGHDSHTHLVELKGDLLLVSGHMEGYSDHIDYFKVYKLVSESEHKWVEVKSLGNNALYLGQLSSISIAVGYETDKKGCRANCIYFIDYFGEIDNSDVRKVCVCVYDMESKHITKVVET